VSGLSAGNQTGWFQRGLLGLNFGLKAKFSDLSLGSS